jgi:cytochrome c553
MTRIATAVLALVFATALLGCPAEKKAEVAPQVPATAAAPADEAKTKFETLCATCHGTTGLGDGPAAAALDPKPRSYSDAEWQTSVTDEHIAKVIVEGGAAAGKSPLMPANPDLKDKPEVVKELVKIIRSYKK